MNTPIPPASPYKRPSFPDLKAQRESTARLAAQLDRHAAREGVRLHRPVPAAQLAGVIRETNARRTLDRAVDPFSPEMMRRARTEIMQLCDQFEGQVDEANAAGTATSFHTGVGMLTSSVREFCKALDDEAPTPERVRSLNATQSKTAEALAIIDRMLGHR